MASQVINPKFKAMVDAVPAGPKEFDWATVTALYPFLADLDQSTQDPIHHQEGSVGTHTRMVIQELLKSPAYTSLQPRDQFKLFWAAVFHDSGKPGTREETSDGRVTNNGHSKLGSLIARENMRANCVPFSLREEICNLIVMHQWPFYLYETTERRSEMQQRKDAIKASLLGDTRHLLQHALADARGRVSADNQDIEDRVNLTELLFDELGLLGRQFPFPNNESRVACFDHPDREPAFEAAEKFRCRVTVMAGLQGSGKDTWLSSNRHGLPVVSLDQLRIDMGLKHSDNQGSVVQAANELAKTHLRAGRDFCWNATNVLTEMRGKVLRLLRAYNAEIELVYLETTPDVLLKQNGNRKASVPPDAINRLARKMEPPLPWEAHHITTVLPTSLISEEIFDEAIPAPRMK